MAQSTDEHSSASKMPTPQLRELLKTSWYEALVQLHNSRVLQILETVDRMYSQKDN
jgi:hypothetical protein